MLIFIVPLQSREASKNWELVCQLARRTLASILRQQHRDFRVLLVCNEPPIGAPDDERLTMVQRDFPVPDMSVWENRMADKWGKVRAGLVALREFAPCHVMVVDADDCVSNRLAGYVSAHPEPAGWSFEQGWMHDEGSRLILWRRRDFDAVCGTSNVLKVSPDDLPQTETGPREENFLLRSGHTKIRENMRARGTPLEPLPFAGAVYNLATGENHTSFSLKGWRSRKVLLAKLLSYRLLTTRIREEFGLSDISPR